MDGAVRRLEIDSYSPGGGLSEEGRSACLALIIDKQGEAIAHFRVEAKTEQGVVAVTRGCLHCKAPDRQTLELNRDGVGAVEKLVLPKSAQVRGQDDRSNFSIVANRAAHPAAERFGGLIIDAQVHPYRCRRVERLRPSPRWV